MRNWDWSIALIMAGLAGISALFALDHYTGWSAADVSQAYRCGVMREARVHDGPTPFEDIEKICTRLQRAAWSTEERAMADCLEKAGFGNYPLWNGMTPMASRRFQDQIACVPHGLGPINRPP